MGNRINNNHAFGFSNKSKEQAAQGSIKEELRLARLSVVSKAFGELHVTGCKYDMPAILTALGVSQKIVAQESIAEVTPQQPADIAVSGDQAVTFEQLQRNAQNAARSTGDYDELAA